MNYFVETDLETDFETDLDMDLDQTNLLLFF